MEAKKRRPRIIGASMERSAEPNGFQRYGTPAHPKRYYVINWGLKKYIKSSERAEFIAHGSKIYEEA